MNPSIEKRRRRATTQTTNLSLIDALSDSTDYDSGAPRKRQRRTGNSDDLESSLTESTEKITTDDAIASQPTPPATPNIYLQDQINLIRSEILDDKYHSQIADTNFTDDTHHWSDNSSLSDDYWHFLGQYE